MLPYNEVYVCKYQVMFYGCSYYYDFVYDIIITVLCELLIIIFQCTFESGLEEIADYVHQSLCTSPSFFVGGAGTRDVYGYNSTATYCCCIHHLIRRVKVESKLIKMAPAQLLQQCVCVQQINDSQTVVTRFLCIRSA